MTSKGGLYSYFILLSNWFDLLHKLVKILKNTKTLTYGWSLQNNYVNVTLAMVSIQAQLANLHDFDAYRGKLLTQNCTI